MQRHVAGLIPYIVRDDIHGILPEICIRATFLEQRLNTAFQLVHDVFAGADLKSVSGSLVSSHASRYCFYGARPAVLVEVELANTPPHSGVHLLSSRTAAVVPNLIAGNVQVESEVNFMLHEFHNTSHRFIGRVVTNLNRTDADHSVA